MRTKFKGFFAFAKGRLFVTVYSFVLAYLFVDLIGLPYWKFGMFFIPLNFIANYFIYKRIFNNGRKECLI